MKRTITTILMLCLMILAVSAQKTELLKGKWKFKDVTGKEKLDPLLIECFS